MSFLEIYHQWCTDSYFDETTRQELLAIQEDEKEIEDRFYRTLEFGTGGLRGVLGAGTNRMNIYTVRQATQGLANYIIAQGGQEKGVVIAHDSRRMSPEFSREAALCLNANGIRTYLFESLRPTPELSFAVRQLGCIAGVCVTASHNPRQYNGYKVYWEDGAQITPPHDKNILAEVAKVESFVQVKTMDEDDARAEGLFRVVGTDFDELYQEQVLSQSMLMSGASCKAESVVKSEPTVKSESKPVSELMTEPELPSAKNSDTNCGVDCCTNASAGFAGSRNKDTDAARETAAAAAEIKIVYTPLNGAGSVPVRQLLKKLGFQQVYTVEEQKRPDGNFPTLPYPNPEIDSAWELALALGRNVDADLILATDPDADRLGAKVKDAATGEYINFTGNMSGMLIAEYILSMRKERGDLPENAALVETIVTTDMAKAIAADYGVDIIEVLTGFKYIGEQIRIFEETGAHTYVFGLEESYGCLAGTYARDKDACVAVMLLCEAAAYYRTLGKTLWDVMIEMYEKYGYYKEGLATLTLAGIDGAGQIQAKMTGYRENPPKKLGGMDILAVRDYKSGVRTDLVTGQQEPTGLPNSNVLYYELADNGWCCVRPSGTEPKIKYYYGVKGQSLEDAEVRLEQLKENLLESQ